MKKPGRSRSLAILILLVFSQIARAADLPYRTVDAFPKLWFEDPLYLTYPKDGTNRLFVVEAEGRVFAFENRRDVEKADLVLDICSRVGRGPMGEGLLGLAFHPEFKTNGYIFLFYAVGMTPHQFNAVKKKVKKNLPLRTRLARFTYDFQRAVIDPSSEKTILEIRKPYRDHSGGMIEFGPDGKLYISVGDGGSDDFSASQKNGQKLGTWLGKILRIDVDRPSGKRAYSVPVDNPFLGNPKAKPEIWAYGLRNVWRFSFDSANGTLWAGDVGLVTWEEINIIQKGGNYGWCVREGKHPSHWTMRKGKHTSPGFRGGKPKDNFIDPVIELPHEVAQCVIGGYVYRGNRLPDLAGDYVYADHLSNTIWALHDPVNILNREIATAELITSFGLDRAGEIYFTSLDGKIYTLEKAP